MALRLGTKAPAALPAAAPSALALPKKVKLNPIAQATLQALDGPRPQAKTDLPFDPQPEGNVWTAFPLHDLGLIRTTGRHGQAFRLDSGSLRGMALMVRRVVDEGRQGFEISFEARGAAGETYRRRLVDRGAKTTTCSFRVATPDESTDGRSRLVEGSGTATVSGEALVLEHPGRWRVSFVAHKPEALRGSMRLRVFGDDKAATEALSDAIIRLGLQSAFAPPAQQATDRLKLLRSLWAAHPEIQLGYRSLEDLAPAIEQACHRESIPPPTRAPLSPEELGLVELALKVSPRALIHIIHEKRSSFEEGEGFASDLQQELRRELNLDNQQLEEAKKTPVSPERAQVLLRLSTLAAEAPATAMALVARDVEGLKPAQLEAALASHGVDTSPERLAELSINEVYPGYFTVYDPKVAEAAEQAGAAYLYSTADNPERVHGILCGGQKSSLTRYGEGILIEGMSSAADFATGGARSVFSRLVTRSAIDRARSQSGSSSAMRFNDWGGERPYKLILDRRILGRTDWYGFTGDSYGQTKKLSAQHRGVNIVKAIDQRYSPSNEIMFPVGNDPKFIRGVVTATNEQRDELITYLSERGITEIQGRPLAEAIMVSTRLCALPEDCTPLMSAEDALYQSNAHATIRAAATEAVPAAAQALRSELEVAARPVVEAVAASVPEPYVDNLIIAVGQGLLGDKGAAIEAIASPLAQPLAEQARSAARAELELQLDETYNFTGALVFKGLNEELGMSSRLREAGTAAVEAAKAAGQSVEEQRSAAIAAMKSAATAALEGAAPQITGAIMSQLQQVFVPMACSSLEYASFVAEASAQVPAAALEPMAKELMEEGRAEARTKAGEQYVAGWVASAMQLASASDEQRISQAAARVVDATLAAIAPRLADEVAPAATDAVKEILKKRGQSLNEEELLGIVGGAIESVAKNAAQPAAKSEVAQVYASAARSWAQSMAVARRDQRIPEIVDAKGPAAMMRAVRSAVQAQIAKDLAVEVEAEAKKLTIPTYVRNAVTSSYNKELERMGRKIALELTTPPEGSADA